MDNLVIISQGLYQPPLFYFFFGGLILLSGIVVLLYLSRRRQQEAEISGALRKEKADKEKALAEIEGVRRQCAEVKLELEARIKELAVIDKFREDLSGKDAQLKNELANKQLLLADFKAVEGQCMAIKNELVLKEEELNKLKERYGELERFCGAMKQALALEKNMHSRLKEEHANCRSLDFKV